VTSQVLFKSLEHSVPDVFVEPSQRGDHLPILDFNTLAEKYLSGMAHLYVHMRTLADFQNRFGRFPGLQSLLIDVHTADIPIKERKVVDPIRQGNDVDLSVLVPVRRFIEQPEEILIRWCPSHVWAQVADVGLSVGIDESDAVVPDDDRARGSFTRDGERDLFLLVGSHRGSFGFGQGEREIIERIPKGLEGITDNETQFIWKRLKLLCHETKAPLAIGLLKDGIAAVINPFPDQSLGLVRVELRPGQLTSVTQGVQIS
jgi:hypothetical protein